MHLAAVTTKNMVILSHMTRMSTQETLKQSIVTCLSSSWTHHRTPVCSRAPSYYQQRFRHHQVTKLTAATVESRLGGMRQLTSSASVATAQAKAASGTSLQLDEAFLNLVRERLEEKDDTSAYFMHCKEDPVRQAGVFMPLCVYKGVPSVLFTIRASNMRNHKGEVSFPGGKRDPTDKTVLDTALREMEEEIFIPRDNVEVLGECGALPNKGCTMKVHPFVGYIKEPIEDLSSIRFNQDEVQKVFAVPLQHLMDPEKRSLVQFRNSKVLYPVWKVDEENITIWGLTAFILDGVLRRIAKEGPAQAIEIPNGANAERYRPPKPSAFV